ncbi:MAG: hypothetical protein MUC35_04530 [Candidatus Margulisbacteria bacterium]|nr:hypothetical protein [Candidatus Margulisiibacteriota bacterium]
MMKKSAIICCQIIMASAVWAAAPTLDFQPQTTPLVPPDAESAIVEPAPAAPTAEYPVYQKEKGLFKLAAAGRVNGFYLLNRQGQQGLFGLLGATGDLIIRDPQQWGRQLGLAEDALEYLVGTGLLIGNGLNAHGFFSVPLDLGARLNFRERSAWDRTPYCGAGLALNIFGTEGRLGGLGFRLYAGLEEDMASSEFPLSWQIGYGSYVITESIRSEGVIFSVGRPVRL